MLDVQEHETVAVGSARSFGIVFCIVFAVIGLWPLMNGEALRMWSVAIAAVFLTDIPDLNFTISVRF